MVWAAVFQVHDYYLHLRRKDFPQALMALYRLFFASLMLRNAKSVHWGTAHNYPKLILANLLVLAHWTKTNYVAKQMMEENMSCVNEELGEMTFSILSRSVLGDQHKANIDHMNDLYALLPMYRTIDRDINQDVQSSTSLSWRHKIDPDGAEVAAVTLFFRQKIAEVSWQNFKTYDGSLASYKSRVGAAAHLTESVSPIVWMEYVLREVPQVFKQVETDVNGYWLHRYTNIWNVGLENDPIRQQLLAERDSDDSDESDNDSYDGEESPQEEDDSVQWGADWEDCQVGSFALSRAVWHHPSRGDLNGVCVHKIKSINAEVELDESTDHVYHSFMGREYLCSKTQTDYRQVVYQDAKWWTQPGRDDNHKVMSYDVIAYFPQLGHLGVLPPPILAILKEQREVHGIGLFSDLI